MGYQNIASLFVALVLVSACSSKPKNDYDLNYDFKALQSFTQLAPQPSDDPLSAQRIQTEITQQLSQKGFTENASSPDFKVAYGLLTQDKPKDSGLSIGLGTGSFGRSGGIGVGTSVGVPLGSDTAKIQTIQIDIIDTKTNKLIWRGTDSFDFDGDGDKKAQDTAKAVSRILAQFPPQP
ncbi:DUF4136 domain-containing protein [Shewanella mangrovisoli]|uniref:DUF4136 domain-containing protein n=1 Tax=Shewanella mangrovisoli TaxID=2864211 RepID=UPI0035B8A482